MRRLAAILFHSSIYRLRGRIISAAESIIRIGSGGSLKLCLIAVYNGCEAEKTPAAESTIRIGSSDSLPAYFFHVLGENRSSIGNSSSLPASISNIRIILVGSEKTL